MESWPSLAASVSAESFVWFSILGLRRFSTKICRTRLLFPARTALVNSNSFLKDISDVTSQSSFSYPSECVNAPC